MRTLWRLQRSLSSSGASVGTIVDEGMAFQGFKGFRTERLWKLAF